MPNVTEHPCILFADDIFIVISYKDKTQTYDTILNSTLENIVCWLEDNDLHINFNKTKYVQFRNYKSLHLQPKIQCRDKKISETKTIKFLGLILDEHCNWKSHINSVCERINRFIYALRKLRRTTSESAALVAYHGYVASVLRYGLLIWGNSTDINNAFLVQKKCVRAICGVGPLDSCKPLFRRLKILTLVSMYILDIALFVKNHPQLFVKVTDTSKFTQRDPTKLRHPLCRSTLHQKNCFVMTVKVFNKLPQNIREASSNYMRILLRKWLLEKCFYTLEDFFKSK